MTDKAKKELFVELSLNIKTDISQNNKLIKRAELPTKLMFYNLSEKQQIDTLQHYCPIKV